MDVVRGSQLDYYHVMAKAKKELTEIATKGYVLEAADTILKGIQEMLDELGGKIDNKFGSLDERFDKIDKRFDKVELELRSLKDEVKGIKSDLSVTVSLEKFNRLKTKVDRLISSN